MDSLTFTPDVDNETIDEQLGLESNAELEQLKADRRKFSEQLENDPELRKKYIESEKKRVELAQAEQLIDTLQQKLCKNNEDNKNNDKTEFKKEQNNVTKQNIDSKTNYKLPIDDVDDTMPDQETSGKTIIIQKIVIKNVTINF